LRVVPRVEVQAAEDLLVWPVARREPRRLQVTVSSNAREAVRGRLELAAPAPWPAVAPVPFALEPGGEQGLELVIPPPQSPRGLAPGRYDLRLSAVLEDGQRFDLAVPVLDYPHIRPTPRPDPARLEVSAADLQLPPGTALPLVVRGTETIRPTDATVFAAEDSVIALLPIDNEPEVRELLMGSME